MVAVSYCRSFSLLLVFLGLATALPSGAPPQACVSLVPGHGAVPIDPALRPPPYFIVSDLLMKNGSLVYESNETYNISLISVLGATFRGFIVQARDVNGSVIGMMDTSGFNGQARLADCPDSNNSTVTHVNNYDKSSISFQWTAPSGFGGIVELRYSVVIMFASYYVNLNAADFPVNCNITLTDVGTHPLIFRMPENCPRQECEYFVGLGLNPSDPTYLDVYLEGNAAGWIAIGFSNNTQMENDDVLGCRVNSGTVTVVDTWNPSPRQAPNMLDATQDGLCVQSTSFTNSRITCSLSRLINGTDIGQDYDLDNLFYLLYGRRAADQGPLTSLGYHTANGGMTPSISPIQYNPVNDNNTDGRCPVEVTGIESHNLVFGMPEGCLRADCEYYVGLSPNPSDPTYLDVYLEGNAAGWIAIGFSLNTQMENDDVLGCRVNSGAVTVVDTWNPSPRRAANMLDATQDGLCVQSTSFTNGRITCRFSRTINITDVGQDYNLNSSYHLLFGRRAADQGVTTVLGYHTENGGMTPAISEQQFNPVVDNNANERCPSQATAVGSHNLLFGMPQGCDRSSCEYYVGLSPNPSDPTYLDVYLEGNAAGWIAIGFSNNTQMENDDVLGCRVNSGAVTVVDTWNPSSRRAANMLDATQDGLCVQSTSFTSSRITCRFSRTINITDVGQDYNLNGSFYLLFGRRAADQGSTTVLGYHTENGGMTPTVSQLQYNPVLDFSNNTCPAQTTAVGSHNLVFGMPEGCERSSCEYYVGLSPNPLAPSYLDVYLEGNASGWIAIGFSLNTQMENDDVLGCRVNSGNVTVVDTWNPSPRRAANMLDATQDGLCVQSTSFTNGRITCRFSRTINITDVGQDYNLDNSYYLLFGRRAADQDNATFLSYHTANGGMTPTISAQQYNPVRDRNTGGCPPVPPTDDLVYTFQQGTQGSGYYFGARVNRTNPLYLDVRLEASASGWVGVGFSADNRMGVDDVLACQRDPNSNVVTAVDTWNPGPAREPNQIDPGQNDICPYTGSFDNGRIICTFSRLINTGDADNDLNLGASLFQLYGTSNTGGVSSLAQHSDTPEVTTQAIVVTDNNNMICPVQTTAVGSHNLVFGMPQGCERSTCEYYVGLSPNPSDPTYLDVYLEGNATGWIAIGFSNNTQMENDDVLGCRVNSGAVTVVDTWNPSTRRAANMLDATQDGLCVQSTSFTNGRITCSFSRTIVVTDVGQDYNLDSSYYLLFGRRAADQGATPVLDYHTANGGMTPTISTQQYNPIRDRNTGGCPPVAPTDDLVYTFQQGTQGSGYYFGARINRTNPLYLDMRLEASASGWVGVGFSEDNRMGVDDVLACQRDPNSNMVTAVDTWNPGPAREPNQIDPGQNDICSYTGDFENGRIICTFSRLINTGDTDNDLNLGMALFQLYGTSNVRGVSSLAQHGETPDVTAEAIVVTNATGAPTDNFPRRELTRIHGILMIVAWPLLVVSAIFFALWMKPALPNGEWFQIHRAFMIVSLFLTALGFIFIFVANAKNPGAPSPGLISFACGKSTGHFVIGIIVFILQIMNPIIAIFRCKPTGSYRWIFNLIHGTAIGFLAEILALVNVGLGIALLESGCGGTNSFTLLWVYIVFVILLVIIQLVMTIVFTVMAFRAPPEKRAALGPTFLKYYFQRSAKSSFSPPQKYMEMTEKGKAASNDPPPKKKPSEDSPFRWGGFGVFIIITFVLVVVMAIMVAVI